MNTIAASSHSKFRPKKIISIFVAIIVINSMLLSSATSTQAWAALEAKETGAQTVSGPTVLQGMDEPPPADQAVVADKNNPAWVTHYGTQAGLKYLPPRQPTFETAPQGPSVTLGAWQIFDLSQAHTVEAIQVVPDGRLFAAVSANGLRVYGPTGDGSYAWSEIHAALFGLASDNVTCLAYLDGSLWVGTSDQGISILDLAAGTWSYIYTGNSQLPSDYIWRITPVPYYLPDHEVWISTGSGAALYYFDGFNTFWSIYFSGDSVFDTAVQIISNVEHDWIAINGAVEYYNGSSWTALSTGNTGSCAMYEANRIIVDPSNVVWFAAEAQIIPLDGKGSAPQQVGKGVCTYDFGTWTLYDAITPGLPSDLISDLAVDGAGRVWIATRGGAVAYDQGTWLIITQAGGYPIYSDDIISVNTVGEAVWFGHYAEAAFSQYSPNWNRFTSTDMGNAGAIPKAVLVGSARTWIGLGTDLAYWNGSAWNALPIAGNTSNVVALVRDGAGLLWAGTAGHGVYSYDGSTFTHYGVADGLPGSDVTSLAVDHEGRLWVGTHAGLALRGSGYWLAFTTATSGLTSNDILALSNDSTDRIWIGTGDQGINILTTNTLGGSAWSTQTTADGLPSNTVNALATDPTGVVWAATSSGLASWNPGTGAWTAQIAEQALSVASDPQGHIWAGTVNALYLLQGGSWLPFHATGTMLGGDHVIALASDGDLLWALGNGIVAVRGVLTGPIGFFAPDITGFSPSQGSVGDTVTIDGFFFDDRDPSFNEVLFGDPFNAAQRAQVVNASSTQLVVTVPSLALNGPIYVRAHGLAGQSSNNFSIVPAIAFISPTCIGMGGTLYVYGGGFTSSSSDVLYISMGGGPWRQADVYDPTLVRQILRPGDLSGPVSLRMGSTGTVFTSSQSIGISQPQVIGQPFISQGIESERMIWGKRTLIILSLQATGSGCSAQVDSGYIEWKLANGSTQLDSDAFLPNSWGMQVGTNPTGTALDKAPSFVLGYPPAASDFNGARIHLSNGPVELITYDIPPSSFNFLNMGSRHHFLNIAVLPATGYSDALYKTYLANAELGLLNTARGYPQQDTDPISSINSWMDWGIMTLYWNNQINLKTGSDFDNIRGQVDDYRQLINDNGSPFLDQAMAIVDFNLYVGGSPGGMAMISCYDPFGDCNRNTSVAFNGPNQLAGTYLQESIHVTGWVDSGSPNYASYNSNHSLYDEGQWSNISNCKLGQDFHQALLDETGSPKRVFTLAFQAAPYEFSQAGCTWQNQPRSAMSYVPNHIDSSMFLEPLDYYHTLDWLLDNDNSDIGPFFAETYTQTLRLNGNIDASDVVTITMAYLMGTGGVLTSPAAIGSYELDLLDAGNNQLSSQRFSLPSQKTHEGVMTLFPFSLHVPFPAGAHKAEIRHNGTTIWSATVSAHAPTVSFTAPTGGSYNAASPIPITWTASDADGDPLQFALAYSYDNGTTWQQVAAALTGNSFSWTPGFVHAGAQTRLRLTASDGFNTTQAVSNAFDLTARPPFAIIFAPENGATYTEGQLAHLTGNSMTANGVNKGAFSWWYDSGPTPIGTTRIMSTTLNEVGVHTLSLQVDANGLSDTSSITVTVVADYDHDGMPNAWELTNKLNPLDPSDAFLDADSDGLTNLREYQLGTNPIVVDTDGDTFGDGAEVIAGTDPLRADQFPKTGLVLDVGASTLGWSYMIGGAGLSPWNIWVTNGGTGSLTWSASSDSAWLSVTPGSGTAPTELTIAANPAGKASGTYTGHITVTASGASGSPHEITVTLTVYAAVGLQSVYLPVVKRP